MIKLQHRSTGNDERHRFDTHEKYYEHFVEMEMKVLEKDKVKILWNFSIQTDKN